MRSTPTSCPSTTRKTYELFTAGRTSGLFQFESDGMRDILKRFKPDRLEHLTALNALYRPGPMQMIDDFIKRRHGQTKVTYDHPLLEPILAGTYGVMVYQEQVMQIASALAGYTLGEADILRKAMGKKKADVMATQKDKFLKGCAERGVTEKKASKIWDHMEQFAGYGFNKSHSAAYAWLAYQTAYLKANHPGVLHGRAPDLGAREHRPHGELHRRVPGHGDRGAAAGRQRVRHLLHGHSAATPATPSASGWPPSRTWAKARWRRCWRCGAAASAFSSLFDFCERVDLRAVNRRVVESFIKSGCFDSLDRRRAAMMNALDRAMEVGQKRQRDRDDGQSSLLGHARRRPTRSRRGGGEGAGPRRLAGGRAAGLREGVARLLHHRPSPRALHRPSSRRWPTPPRASCRRWPNARSRWAGSSSGCASSRPRRATAWPRFTLEDLEGGAEVLVFPETYKKVAARLADDVVVLVKGRAESLDEGKSRLLATDVVPLDQARMAETRFVTIRVPLSAWDRAKGERLRDILGSHRGECPVTLEMVRPGGESVAVAPSAYFRVRADQTLRAEVEGLLGPGSVVLARTNGAA